jgi:putative spermidine/putrescine transport system substrate-binding protein
MRMTIKITALWIGLAVACAGWPGGVAAQRFDGVTLRIGTFGGLWRDTMDKELTPKFAAVGGKLEFVTGSPQTNFAKLVAGRGRAAMDVIELLDAQLGEVASSGYFADLDLAKIPNKQYLEPYQYSQSLIASWFTQESICYNVDKYKELALAPPKTYADLGNPALLGHVMIPDINSGGGLAAVGGFAYAAGGDETNISPGLELIRGLKALKFWSQGDQVVLAFQSGDILAAVAHSGWCLRARKTGSPVTTVHPFIKDGTVGVAKIGWLGIVKTSPNIAAAHWFLNEYLDASYQLAFSTTDGVVPVNRLAIAKMGEDPVVAEMLQLDPKAIAQELRIDYSKADLSVWNDQWNRIVVRQ